MPRSLQEIIDEAEALADRLKAYTPEPGSEEESDLRLLCVALLRTIADTGERIDLDDLLAQEGFTRAELEADKFFRGGKGEG